MNRLLKNLVFFLTAIVLTSFLPGCAKVGSISGGPKDEDPPRVIFSQPDNYVTNFNKKRVEIFFDEFVQLRNAQGELLISPPLEKKPLVKLKGKSILIDLNNDLKENTTYTINFGNAIVDNNEGNNLKNYEYVFSTGEYLDSLSIKGKVLWAFDLTPPKERVTVMVYDTVYDSIPFLEKPLYLARTDEFGNFAINNIKDTIYKVFSLKDANNNLLFDLPNEPIAFLDTLIHLTPELTTRFDTLQDMPDSLLLPTNILGITNDTLIVDSTRVDSLRDILKNSFFIDLFLFEEKVYNQYITETKREDKKMLTITFNEPVDSFSLSPVWYPPGNFYIPEFNRDHDTLNIWLTDTAMTYSDTLLMAISYLAKDSAGMDTLIYDTVNFRFQEKEKKKTGRRDKEEMETDTIQIEKSTLSSSISSGSTLDLNKKVVVKSDFPISSIATEKINLFHIPDSIEIKVPFSTREDTLDLNKFYLAHDWEENSKYILIIEPGAIKNIYDLPHDSLVIPFSTREMVYYGKIIARVEKVAGPVILQLLDKKENILKEKFFSSDKVVTFPFLAPGEYMMKIIFDRNKNKKWDTGDYLEERQPERVSYYSEIINARSNWDIEITWIVSDQSIKNQINEK